MMLEVQQVVRDDVLQDIARLHFSHRPMVGVGRILKLSANGKSIYLAARGAPGGVEDRIWLDSETRRRLKVRAGEPYDFTVAKANFIGELCWAWHNTGPAYRIATRLGALSIGLGALSVILGLIALCRS